MRRVLLFHVFVSLNHLRLIRKRCQGLVDIPLIVAELLLPRLVIENVYSRHQSLDIPEFYRS
jgi:hypothetical protein